MNLFVLDENPKTAAQFNCDKHISKIILEVAQMLANCFEEEVLVDAPRTQKGTIRKHSYYNHPVSIWMRETLSNFIWSIEHAFGLEEERNYRGFTTPHFSINFIRWAYDNFDKSVVKYGDLTPFAVAISPDKNCRKISNFDSLCSVEKYRLYYIHDKPFANWTKRDIPYWFKK